LSGVFSFLATLVALVLLLSPFAFAGVWQAATASFVIGTVLAFVLGFNIGRIEKANPFKSGLKYACITMLGAIAAYRIGEILHIYI
jgi:VIT1/CCC1 family predicted Fe2+/Mn2+ transporter